jgi:hypothetical protein
MLALAAPPDLAFDAIIDVFLRSIGAESRPGLVDAMDVMSKMTVILC